MTHAAIEPTDQDRYYAGDAIDIPFEFRDHHDENAIDLTGLSVEFRLKSDLTDPDSEAVLEKTGTEGGTQDGISFPDPTNGQCTVHIDTGDTTTVVEDGDLRSASELMEWHIRVIDSNGARVTSETGDWDIHAS